MGYFVGIVSIVIAIATHKAYKTMLNPCSFFCYLWGIITILAEMRLYGFTGADLYCNFLILIGIIGFLIGSMWLVRKKKTVSIKLRYRRIVKNENKNENENKVNMKMLWIMLLVVFLYTAYKLKLAMPFIMLNSTLGYVRKIYLTVGAGITINALDYFINTVIITGLRLTCEIVIINEIVARRRISKTMLILLIAIIGMNALLSGGRMIVFDFCLFIFFAVRLNGFKSSYNLSLWQKVLVALLITGGVYVLLYITKDRQANQSVLESVYGNFVGGVSLFNTIVTNVIGDRMTFGVMFAYAFVTILYLPLNFFFKIPYPMQDTMNLLVSPFYSVGKTTMNAYITCWGFFYSDFRIPGILIDAIIFGVIAAQYYNKYRKTRSATDTCCYMLILNAMTYSLIRWQLANTSYFLALFLIPLVYKKAYRS